MFSTKIQNLINTSGQEAAMIRASRLARQVNNYNQSQSVNNSNPIEQETKFSKVMQNCAADAYRFREASPKKVVFGSLVKPSSKINSSKLNYNPEITNTTIQNIPNISVTQKSYTRQEISDIISEESKKHGIDEKLVKALIKQESGFNPTIESKAGAVGLMQLMPSTAKSLGVKNSKDPRQNVDGGIRYLKSMMEKYNGNLILALAAYNAGPGAVDKYHGVPPYKETQNYVKNILANYLG